jgi:hypothetical protein
MSQFLSRRDALKTLALAFGAAGIMKPAHQLEAADLPHVSSTDPMAVALAYHEDAHKVDPKQFPTYVPGQACNSCMQLKGTADQSWRPCSVLPGKLVNSNGWCKVYVKKA